MRWHKSMCVGASGRCHTSSTTPTCSGKTSDIADSSSRCVSQVSTTHDADLQAHTPHGPDTHVSGPTPSNFCSSPMTSRGNILTQPMKTTSRYCATTRRLGSSHQTSAWCICLSKGCVVKPESERHPSVVAFACGFTCGRQPYCHVTCKVHLFVATIKSRRCRLVPLASHIRPAHD